MIDLFYILVATSSAKDRTRPRILMN